MHRCLSDLLFSLIMACLLAGCSTPSGGFVPLPFPLDVDDATSAPTTVPVPTAAPAATDTPAPTAAPVAVDTPAAATAPVIIQGSAQKTSFADESSCTAPAQDVTLTVNSDGSAQLYLAGPGFVDHINCTPSASVEGWYVEGTANSADETVAFNTCNMGNFAAEGTASYAGGALAGAVVCRYSKGSAAGNSAIRVTMP
jgi:hypothetical protein